MKKGKVSTTGYRANSKDKDNAFNIIPSNRISMKNVNFPVLGTDDLGNKKLMMPGQEYSFPGKYVVEVPYKKQGGNTNNMKKVTLKEAYPQQPTMNQFFGITFNPMSPVGFYQQGGQPQQGGPDQLMQEVAQALQQGTPPEQIMQMLIQNGVPQQEAQQVIQVVMQQMQGQDQGASQMPADPGMASPPMRKGGLKLPEAFPQQMTLQSVFEGRPWMQKGGWIQDATESIKRRGTEGRCSGANFGGPDCPKGSRQYNLAVTFRNMAKKQFGGSSALQNSDGESVIDNRNNTMKNFLTQNTMRALAMEEADNAAGDFMQEGGSFYNPDMYGQSKFGVAAEQGRDQMKKEWGQFAGNSYNLAMGALNTRAQMNDQADAAYWAGQIKDPNAQQSYPQPLDNSVINPSSEVQGIDYSQSFASQMRRGGRVPKAQNGNEGEWPSVDGATQDANGNWLYADGTQIPFDNPNNPAWNTTWDPYNNVYNPNPTRRASSAVPSTIEQGDPTRMFRSAEYAANQDLLEEENMSNSSSGTSTPNTSGTSRGSSNTSGTSNTNRGSSSQSGNVANECESLFNTQAEVDKCIEERKGNTTANTTATTTEAATTTGTDLTGKGNYTEQADNQGQGSYQQLPNGQIMYVPGGNQSYNMFPANFNPYIKVRGRGPMWQNQFPTMAYNPANTYLDKDVQRSNIFGNKRKMVFSHGYPTTGANGNTVGGSGSYINTTQGQNVNGYGNQRSNEDGFQDYMEQNMNDDLLFKYRNGQLTPEGEKAFAQQEADLRREYGNKVSNRLGKVNPWEGPNYSFKDKRTMKKESRPKEVFRQNPPQRDSGVHPGFADTRENRRANRQANKTNPISAGLPKNFNKRPMQWGGDPNASDAMQQMQNYDPYANSYGKKSKIVIKDKIGLDPEEMVNWGLAGAGALSSLFESGQDYRNQKIMESRMGADALYSVNENPSRGDYDVNSGVFRPDQTGADAQFKGQNWGQIASGNSYAQMGGSQFAQDEEYYLTDEEIAQIESMGGSVQYLD